MFTYSLFTHWFSSLSFVLLKVWYPKSILLSVLDSFQISEEFLILLPFFSEIYFKQTRAQLSMKLEITFFWKPLVPFNFFVYSNKGSSLSVILRIFLNFFRICFKRNPCEMKEFDSEKLIRCHFHFDFRPCRRSTKCTVSHKRRTLCRASGERIRKRTRTRGWWKLFILNIVAHTHEKLPRFRKLFHIASHFCVFEVQVHSLKCIWKDLNWFDWGWKRLVLSGWFLVCWLIHSVIFRVK